MGKGRKRLDFILLIAALALVGIGVVMVYSTSAIIAGDRFGDPYYFLKRQALYAAIGFVLMILMMFFPYEMSEAVCLSHSHPFHSSLDCRIDPGYRVPGRGAMRWLKIQSFSFQPSEFAKLGLVIFLAYFLAKKEEKIRSFSFGFLPTGSPLWSRHRSGDEGTRFWGSLFSHGDGFSSSFRQRCQGDLYCGCLFDCHPGGLLFF